MINYADYVDDLITLFVVLDPVGSVPIFLNATEQLDARDRPKGRRCRRFRVAPRADVFSVFGTVRARGDAHFDPGVSHRGSGGAVHVRITDDLRRSPCER